MAEPTPDEKPLRAGDRVVASHDLTRVPAGTPGRVVGVVGLTWLRYRVRFDNDEQLDCLHRRHLAPEPKAARARR